jgi:hypothetical protein
MIWLNVKSTILCSENRNLEDRTEAGVAMGKIATRRLCRRVTPGIGAAQGAWAV